MKNLLSAHRVILLKDSDSGPFQNIVRVNNVNVKMFSRNNPVLITNTDTGLWTIRYLVGSSGYIGLTKDCIAIDYDGLVELGCTHDCKTSLIDKDNKTVLYQCKSKENYAIQISKPSFLKIQIWLWRTKDLHAKYGNFWGLVGTVLGIISFFI